jgi:hypothetical protein
VLRVPDARFRTAAANTVGLDLRSDDECCRRQRSGMGFARARVGVTALTLDPCVSNGDVGGVSRAKAQSMITSARIPSAVSSWAHIDPLTAPCAERSPVRPLPPGCGTYGRSLAAVRYATDGAAGRAGGSRAREESASAGPCRTPCRKWARSGE